MSQPAAGDSAVICLPDHAATEALAWRLASRFGVGDVLALDGPLGAGKTTFTRALVAALGGNPEHVTSPTYTLMHHYQARLPIIHIDAYRLESPSALLALGFSELREDGLAVVEWSQRVAAIMPAQHWRLVFSHTATGGREVTISDPAGQNVA